MTRHWIRSVAIFLLAGVACFGNDANLTESGKGRPQLSVVFPEQAPPGSVQEAEIEVVNPGPGDMRTVVVAFAAIGPAQGQAELPVPIVAFGTRKENPAVASIDPEPTAVSDDGAVYTFGPICPDGEGAFPEECPNLQSKEPQPRLAEGDSITIRFLLQLPEDPGVAANSLQVYDGEEVDRARGVRLEVMVGR